ncbi:hypothetical protein WH47_06928, partial [Habropoda laboriosa]
FMLYDFRKENMTTNAAGNICAVYEEDVISLSTCRKWFKRFREENFYSNDKKRFGRPCQTGTDKIRNLAGREHSLSV